MKLIKEPHKDKLYFITCANPVCEAVYQTKIKELEYFFDERNEDFYRFQCKCCQKHTSISADQLLRVYSVDNSPR